MATKQKKATTAKKPPAKPPAGQSDKPKPPAKAPAKGPDVVEQAWRDALSDALTNAQKLDVAKSFKEGRPVNVRGTVQVNGARLPFHVVLKAPATKKKK